MDLLETLIKEFDLAVDYSKDGRVKYMGICKPVGASKNSESWDIVKPVYEGNSIVSARHAEGVSDHRKIWDEREKYGYPDV